MTALIKYATLIMQRYKDKVTYWIPVNQINLTDGELYSRNCKRYSDTIGTKEY